jgi:hypothetical protein
VVIEWHDNISDTPLCPKGPNQGDNNLIDGPYWIYRSMDDPSIDADEILDELSMPVADGQNCYTDTTTDPAHDYYYKIWNYPITTDAPDVFTLVPAHGTSLSKITLYGDNFQPGAAVQFGSGYATKVTFLSAQKLTCFPPPGTPGTTVAVTITNPNGQHGTKDPAFTYDSLR